MAQPAAHKQSAVSGAEIDSDDVLRHDCRSVLLDFDFRRSENREFLLTDRGKIDGGDHPAAMA